MNEISQIIKKIKRLSESKKDEEPGKSVSNLLIRPPVQDSTDDIISFFDSDSLLIFFMI